HCFDLHGNQGLAVIIVSADPKCDVPRSWRQWICHPIKINRTAMAIALTQTKDEMLFVNYSRRGNRLDLACKKKWLGISIAKGLQHLVPLQKIYVDLHERQL